MKGRLAQHYLHDMIDALAKAQRFVAGFDYPRFESDEKTAFAHVPRPELGPRHPSGSSTRRAEQCGMYVIRADGSLFSRQQTSFDGAKANWFAGWWSGDSFLAQKLDAGDTVVVPRQIEKIAWMREIKDITQIISQVALTAGVLIAAGL